MTRHSRIFLVLIFFGVPALANGKVVYFDVSIPPQEKEHHASADFRISIPDVKYVRGVIIRQHGCGRKGIDHADDLQWQALAKKHDSALLGTHFTSKTEDCKDWWEPTNGSELALLAALEQFAAKSKHPELVKAPWAIWGHSGGSLWAMRMTYRHPERTIAVCARSQAITGPEEKPWQVPILINYGEGEKEGSFAAVHRNSKAAFDAFRPKGALWAIAVDPKSGHDCRNSRLLAIPYFDAVLKQRLPKSGDAAPTLKAVDTDQAWLGNLQSLEIAPAAKYTGDKSKAAWLPDANVAQAWQEYCKTGEVNDNTPPPAPTRVRIGKWDKDLIFIEWHADADLESGIKAFHIYRDGKKVSSLAGEPNLSTGQVNPNKDYFQIWNNGDEPTTRPRPFLVIDEIHPGAVYSVSTENFAGLESEKTRAK